MQITHDDPSAQLNSARDGFLFNAALAWASKGRPVFACAPNKRPAIAKTEGGRGYLDASTDPDVIRWQFSRPAAALIGMPTGAVSGIDGLDCDPKNGGDAWLTENWHRIPRTRVHRTRSGGWHILFTSHQLLRCSQSVLAPGVDIRASGGYLIVPPSPGYTVEIAAPLAPWPEWLLEATLPPPKPERPATPPDDYVPAGPARLEGIRKAILAKVARAQDGEKHCARLKAGRALGGIADELGFSDETAIAWVMAALPTKSGSDAHDRAAEKTIQYGLNDGRKAPLVLEEREHPVLRGAR